MTKLSKAKAITILLYDTMVLGVKKPTSFYMKVLEINHRELLEPIKLLRTNGLIKCQEGSKDGGIEKTVDVSIEKLSSILGVECLNQDELIQKCERIIDVSRQVYYCDVCNESVPFLDRNDMCLDCSQLTQPESIARLAKCGHLSKDRYFNCLDCQPELESDEFIEHSLTI